MHFVNSVSKNTSNFDLETLYKPSQIAIATKFQLSLTNLYTKESSAIWPAGSQVFKP